jgi:hypothetical protein
MESALELPTIDCNLHDAIGFVVLKSGRFGVSLARATAALNAITMNQYVGNCFMILQRNRKSAIAPRASG